MILKKLLSIGLVWLWSSTAVQAETTQFVCDDWISRDGGSYAGSLFIGKKTNKGYTIKNTEGNTIELVYLGDYNTSGVLLYTGIDPKYSTPSFKQMTPYAVFTSKHLGEYDFQIIQFRTVNGNNNTRCKFQ